MKRAIAVIMILLIIASMLAGCSNKTTKDEEPAANVQPDQANTTASAVNDFNDMIASNKKPYELLGFIDNNIGKLDKDKASELLGKAIQKIEENEYQYNEIMYSDNMQELMLKYFESGFDQEKMKYVQEEDLKNLLSEIINGGYKIMSAEGSVMVVIDYEALKKYSGFITDEMKDFIEIMALQTDEPITVEEDVNASWTDITNRIIKIEDYLNKYKSNERREAVKEAYTGYLMVYLGGMDEVQTFDYETDQLMDGMLDNYNAAINKYKNSYLTKILKEYLSLLEQENYTYTENVQDYIINLADTVNSLIQ